jgi:RimJ/RimL family protein N-acetyltransferase
VREVEVAYALGREAWGRGYGTEAARATRDWAFTNLEVDYVISLIIPENENSIRVAGKNGMTFWKEGHFRTIPVHVYRIMRQEWERLSAATGG